MSTFEDAVERAARAGYEKMLQLSGMFVNKHPWEKETAECRQDWIKTTETILETYAQLRTDDKETA